MLKHKYQEEYEQSHCFWGTKPSKYVKLFVEKFGNNLVGKTFLDLGAGEGKNSVFLANYGATVISVDLSKIALETKSPFFLGPITGLIKRPSALINSRASF